MNEFPSHTRLTVRVSEEVPRQYCAQVLENLQVGL